MNSLISDSAWIHGEISTLEDLAGPGGWRLERKWMCLSPLAHEAMGSGALRGAPHQADVARPRQVQARSARTHLISSSARGIYDALIPLALRVGLTVT